MKDKNIHFKILLASTIFSLALGSLFYHVFEKWSWLDSIYFSVITLSTIGYGDFVPVTSVGKIFTMFYIFIGIGIVFGFIHAITVKRRSHYFHKRKSKK